MSSVDKKKAKKVSKKSRSTKVDSTNIRDDGSVPSMDELSVDLSSLTLMELSQKERSRLRAPRMGVESPASRAMELSLEEPGLLGIPGSLQEEIREGLEHLQTAKTLLPFEEWLKQNLDLVQSTRRFHMTKVGEVLRKITKRARLLREESPQDAEPFDELLDFYSTKS